MVRTESEKRQINVEVDREVAEYIRAQPHQGRYIELLVRRDMGADFTLLQRIATLENAVHENHVKVDGLDFPFHGCRYTSAMGYISKFRFNVKEPMLNMELQTLGDGSTMRSFAFRNSEGHFAGKARLLFKQNEPLPFVFEFESITRIGDRLIVPIDVKPKKLLPPNPDGSPSKELPWCQEHMMDGARVIEGDYDCAITSCDKKAIGAYALD